MPIRRSSQPFSWVSPTTPHSKPLRQVIAAYPTLNGAAKAWDSHSYDEVPVSGGRTIAGHSTAADARKDAHYQSFLNGANPPGGSAAIGQALVSPFAVSDEIRGAEVSADRLTTATTVDTSVGSLKLGTSPYATAIGGTGSFGNKGTLGGLAVAGKKSKTLALNASLGDTIGGCLGVTLVAENKINPIGEAITSEDGTIRRLVRLKSSVMPVLDLGLASATDHFGVGIRLVVAVGQEAIYEKFAPIATAAAEMRKRDHWYRNIVETAAAIGISKKFKHLSRSQLAASPGQIDGMLPGESATWRSSRGVLLGVSAGMYGARVNGQYHVQAEVAYRLQRQPQGIVQLSVQPYKIEGARLSAEVRLLADAGAHFLTAVSQLRAWSFDLAIPEARVALSKALAGELPGQLPPLGLSSFAGTAAIATQVGSDSLPEGVHHLETTCTRARATVLSLTGIQLPEFLGAQSLGLSSETTMSSVGTVQPDIVEFTETSERSRQQDLLTLGSLSQRDSAALVTALSIGPDGQTRAEPPQIVTVISRETAGSNAFGRKRVLAGITANQRFAGISRATSVQSTPRYTAQLQRSISLGSLQHAASISNARIHDLAQQRRLPLDHLIEARRAAANAVATGTHGSLVRLLKTATRHGHKSIESLHALAGDSDLRLTVSNEGHDRLLSDFFKAETYLLGARKTRHAHKVVLRFERLLSRIDKAAKELEGDALARQMPNALARKSLDFLHVLRAESSLLLAQLKAQLEG